MVRCGARSGVLVKCGVVVLEVVCNSKVWC